MINTDVVVTYDNREYIYNSDDIVLETFSWTDNGFTLNADLEPMYCVTATLNDDSSDQEYQIIWQADTYMDDDGNSCVDDDANWDHPIAVREI